MTYLYLQTLFIFPKQTLSNLMKKCGVLEADKTPITFLKSLNK